ncbi:hypothetical protein HOG17_01395 [Candidatus Peregrinibacteria bacterium]|jgi:hypothetical protein|nr:hypothetical protein [Candidatus Peregrinibacteria bacterium]MBT4148387.1 hypothetical protein [Candidatus Peregrinibacteria bacterium]MBT4365873.1 hypothetical protein [Candidatus Peregrinibacteria bacterium]MBT4456504.1 hypothetical protein [Candidatus Peregrinibacteria bacterium]
MAKPIDLIAGGPVASTNVLTQDTALTDRMDRNAEKLQCEPILDAIRSTRDLVKHAVVDVPLQTWEKVKNLTVNLLTAPFLKVAQIVTNVKNSVQAVLGGGMLAIEGLVSTPVSSVGGKIRSFKPDQSEPLPA